MKTMITAAVIALFLIACVNNTAPTPTADSTKVDSVKVDTTGLDSGTVVTLPTAK